MWQPTCAEPEKAFLPRTATQRDCTLARAEKSFVGGFLSWGIRGHRWCLSRLCHFHHPTSPAHSSIPRNFVTRRGLEPSSTRGGGGGGSGVDALRALAGPAAPPHPRPRPPDQPHRRQPHHRRQQRHPHRTQRPPRRLPLTPTPAAASARPLGCDERPPDRAGVHRRRLRPPVRPGLSGPRWDCGGQRGGH